MNFIPRSRNEWIGQMKLAVFVLASFGYLFFLAEGWSTGLGVYHNPGFCWVAGAFALLALVVASTSQRRVAIVALVIAIIVGLYGSHQNGIWREKLKKAESHNVEPGRWRQSTWAVAVL